MSELYIWIYNTVLNSDYLTTHFKPQPTPHTTPCLSQNARYAFICFVHLPINYSIHIHHGSRRFQNTHWYRMATINAIHVCSDFLPNRKIQHPSPSLSASQPPPSCISHHPPPLHTPFLVRNTQTFTHQYSYCFHYCFGLFSVPPPHGLPSPVWFKQWGYSMQCPLLATNTHQHVKFSPRVSRSSR